MLDKDLALLYGVETKRLNEQVRRNIDRFPSDFMFKLNQNEVNNLFAHKNEFGGNRYLPFAFTENGVSMLSSVLNSKQAIQVNISIMRIFTSLRGFLLLEEKIIDRIEQLEFDTNKMFKIVFERLDTYEEIVAPTLVENRKRIGIKQS